MGVIISEGSGIEEHGGEMGKRWITSLFSVHFPAAWSNAWERESFSPFPEISFSSTVSWETRLFINT